MKKKIQRLKIFQSFFLRLEFYSRILLLVFDRNCSHPAWAEVILKKPLFFTTSESVEKKKSFPRHLQKWKCSKVNSVFCREINCFDISMVAIKWIINYFEYCRSQKNFLTSFGWTRRLGSGSKWRGWELAFCIDVGDIDLVWLFHCELELNKNLFLSGFETCW